MRWFDARGARGARRIAAVVVAVALGTGFAAYRMMSPSPPERIVLIVVDTLRRDFLPFHGGSIPTPNIERLAARGQVLENAVGSFHQTTMSMGALFTGKTPSLTRGNESMLDWNGRTWCGMARFAKDPADECLPRTLQTLGQVLHDRGYWTIGVVSNPFLFEPAGFARGFDEWREVGEPGDARRVNAAAKEALARRPSDRFFLYLHYMDVHDYARKAVGHPDWRELYGQAVKRVDAAIGDIVEALDAAGLLEGTQFVLTADHGEQLQEPHFISVPHAFEPAPGVGHTGNPSFEQVLEVPLVVSPARVPDRNRLVRSEDVFRLIAGFAGATPAAPEILDDELFLTELWWRTYRRGRWKSFWDRQLQRFFLVDLEADPSEQKDVAALHPEIVEQHRKRGQTLGNALAAAAPPPSTLTPRDEGRLRALGYLR